MFKLRPYQQEACDKAILYFKSNSTPALIVLPTGAGKSLVIAELTRIAKGRVLILAHVKELIEQNYQKLKALGEDAGIYSAGLNKKDTAQKLIFASIQSVANAPFDFFEKFSLLIIDECHRISLNKESQYQEVYQKLKDNNHNIKVLGLTATPYRLDMGWIYNYHYKGILRTEEERFFKKCIYELSLRFMIKNDYLTPPVLIDSPVACYDFSKIKIKKESGRYSLDDIKGVLKDQKRITPSIIKNILDQSIDRKGVMIFTSSVDHAKEVLKLLPCNKSSIVTAKTDIKMRDILIKDFKEQKIKYLVNVSVLTTGFDAPHVDLIAILRPTESVGLYQQIVGRGLRLYENKQDCLVLDYTGVGINIYSPEIGNKKSETDSMPVKVECPKCGFYNDFWGVLDTEGELVEHFGRKCQRGEFDSSDNFIPCGYLYRFKICECCYSENELTAKKCKTCNHSLIDPEKKLKEAMTLKDAHVFRVEHMEFVSSFDKKNKEEFVINYYDYDGESVSEKYKLNNEEQKKAFFHNFLKVHNKLPGRKITFSSSEDLVHKRRLFRTPSFIVARKIKNYWQVREKIFN